VEDEAALRDVSGRILSGAGCHVLAAECGASALELAVRHSQGTLDPGVALLEKPFTAGDLLAAVHRRLDS
jgi:hypothetical protein